MKNVVVYLSILLFCNCTAQTQAPGYKFEIFDNTPVAKLAKAVKIENLSDIKKFVLDDKLDINFQESKYGSTILQLAVINQKINSVKTLLELGADINIRDSQNYAVIHYATNPDDFSKESYSILKLLIEKGSNVNAAAIGKNENKRYYYTPLNGAVRDSASAKLLIENGANLYLKIDNEYLVWFDLLLDFRKENIFTAKYLIIEKKMKIPNPINYTFSGKPLDIFHYLDIKKFPTNIGGEKLKTRQDILNYLKEINYPNNGAFKE